MEWRRVLFRWPRARPVQAGEPFWTGPEDGQLIVMLVPAAVWLILTSSARPAITASESPVVPNSPSPSAHAAPPAVSWPVFCDSAWPAGAGVAAAAWPVLT